MTLPFLGSMSASGFEHSWYFLFLLVVIGFGALYVVVQVLRGKRMLRFANLELLESVAPQRPSWWRHLPAILLVCSLVFSTVGLAGPTREVRIPRNRAVVMLIIDVSPSMQSTDVSPTRLAAAEEAGKQFADESTPGINLGLIAFGGSALLLVSPTTNHDATKTAIDKLQVIERTAIGEAIFTALQSISTVGAVIGVGDTPPPARIVLLSDGKENLPTNPDAPKGAFTAARSARDQGVPISTISFGTPDGYVDFENEHLAVPVADDTLKKVAELSGGKLYHAADIDQLKDVYATLQNQFGYETTRGDASGGWFRLGVFAVTLAALAGLAINRRLPI
jgi:Ca-activated chloride channel family protein